MTKDDGDSSLRVLVAGSGRLGLAVMQPLLESRHQVVGVIQNGRRVHSWERRIMQIQSRITPGLISPMAEAAREHIPVVWLENLDERELKALRKLEPDLLITCGFSIILPESVLSLPRIGCVNVHTALLPKHRGPNPCAWVVYNGDTESGVTIHVTDHGIDTGAILARDRFAVGDMDTSMDVYLASCNLTAAMIRDTVDDIAEHGFDHAQPQSPEEATYDKRFTEEDSRIDWTRPVAELDRLIRAAHAYAPAWFPYGGTNVKVAFAQMAKEPTSEAPGTIVSLDPDLVVATGDGAIRLTSVYTGKRGGTKWPTFMTGLKPGIRLE